MPKKYLVFVAIVTAIQFAINQITIDVVEAETETFKHA